MSTDATKATAWSRDADSSRQQASLLDEAQEFRRARNYPISRWYLRGAAARLAALLAPTRIRPVQLTICGLTAAAAAAATLFWQAEATPIAAALLLVYWFFDRADGLLARRQGTVSAWGAWLDGNVDELVDVGLHVATAAIVAWRVAASWPWLLLIALLAGKYLLMYGLTLEESATSHPQQAAAAHRDGKGSCETASLALWRRIYHLPGNADVRVHLLIVAVATGYLAAELMAVAAYYNMRWIVRYALVARRLGGAR